QACIDVERRGEGPSRKRVCEPLADEARRTKRHGAVGRRFEREVPTASTLGVDAAGDIDFSRLAGRGGEALATPAIGYTFVYHLEIALLFATLVVLGPLVRMAIITPRPTGGTGRIGLADFPT
ncbi:MAG: hypothetical protein ACO3U4_06240, partial [Gemmobacter sp.]